MAISNPSLPSVPDGVHVEELALDVGTLTITARTTAPRAGCPQCGQWSARVHSAYWRTLKDLPWQDRSVTWRVKVRCFRCCRCPGRIFAEPVPGLARAKAQRSDRLAAAQTDIGLALGGEAGASRNGVRRWVRAGAFMPYRRPPASTQLAPHMSLVEARWRDGQHNAAALHRELRAVGFEGGYEII